MYNKYTVSAFLLLLPLFSSAELASFDYVDMGYNNTDFAFSTVDNGYEFKFSKTVSENIYVSGDIVSVLGRNARLSVTTIGVGYKFDFSSSSAFFVEADHAKVDEDDGDGGYIQDGYEVTTGVRSRLSENLDTVIGFERLDLGYYTHDSILLGASYRVLGNFSLYAEVKNGSDASRYGLGFRYNL